VSWRGAQRDRQRDPWAADAFGRDAGGRQAPGARPTPGSMIGPTIRTDRGRLGDVHGPHGDAGIGKRPGTERPRGRLLAGALFGVALGAASSTVTTALAVGVVGRNADRLYQPIEFTVRVALLLVAPCMGAILAALFSAVVPPRRVTPAPWGIGLGVVVGPILALRLDRTQDLGVQTMVTFGVLLACWAVVGGLLAAAAAARATVRRPRDGGDDRFGGF
jgi:hypothetical protein